MARIAEKLEENLHEVHNMIEADHDCSDIKLKETFDTLYQNCSNFSLLCSSPNTGLSMTGKTRLDKERLQQCQRELETIGVQAKQWKNLTNRATLKEKYKGAQGFLDRIRSLIEDVSVRPLTPLLTLNYLPAPARPARHLHLDDQRGQESGLPQDTGKVRPSVYYFSIRQCGDHLSVTSILCVFN